MGKIKAIPKGLIERVRKALFLLCIVLSSTILSLLILSTTASQQQSKLSKFGNLNDEYGIYNTIPSEQENIFQGTRFHEILRLRGSFILGKQDSSIACQFEYEELPEACRQIFGAFSPVENAMLVRGILSRNGICHARDSIKQAYRLYTPNAMGIRNKEDIDLNRRYEDQPQFATILREGELSFSGEKRLELYHLREYYLNEQAYLTRWFNFEYQDLSNAYQQALGAYSPYMNALLLRGTLTAHNQFKMDDSTTTIGYKLMTPIQMGLKLEKNKYARTH